MRIQMQLSTEDLRVIFTVTAESLQDRQMLAMLTHRGVPDDFECDPVGGENGLPREATFFWKSQERGG